MVTTIGFPLLAAVLVALLVAAGRRVLPPAVFVRFMVAVGLWLLVGFQAFRLPLEWLMHEAFRTGLMPMQMSWSGQNFDVLTGASALVVAPLLYRGLGGARLALAWNLVGSALLANILLVAMASTPMVHAFGTSPERLNTFVAAPPYVTLPTVMVVLALAGNLIIFRRLRRGPGPARGAGGLLSRAAG